MRDDYPRASVREVDGQLVLDDPDARAVIRAVERENIRRFLIETARERVAYFVGRIAERGSTGAEFVIVMLCVDDANGAAMAEALMPGHDWTAYRARGEQPWARGLAFRDAQQAMLDKFFPNAAAELRAVQGIAVLAMDSGQVVAFDSTEITDA